MIKVKLPNKFINKLAGFPETGMGYHIVDVMLSSGIILNGREVVNSEYLLLLYREIIETDDIIDIKIF